jgi:hypothetical protein
MSSRKPRAARVRNTLTKEDESTIVSVVSQRVCPG